MGARDGLVDDMREESSSRTVLLVVGSFVDEMRLKVRFTSRDEKRHAHSARGRRTNSRSAILG